jgi:hypothetical protein
MFRNKTKQKMCIFKIFAIIAFVIIFIGLFVVIIELIRLTIEIYSKEARERNKLLKQLYQQLSDR